MIKKISISLLLLLFSNSLLFSQAERIDSLTSLYEKTLNEESQLELLLKISEENLYIRNFEKTLFYAQKGLDVSRKNKNVMSELDFLELFGKCYYHSLQHDKSLQYFNEILELSDTKVFFKNRGFAFSGISRNYWRKGKYDKAIYFGTEAIKTFESLNDIINVAIAKANLGTVYLDIGEYDRAKNIFDETLLIYEIIKDTSGIANVYEKKGAIYFFESHYTLARKSYYRAYNLFVSIGKEMEAAIELGNIGETYEMEGKYEKAIDYYKQAIVIENKYEYYSGLIFIYQALGRTYYKKGNFEKANKSYIKSLHYINKIGEHREYPNVYKLLYELSEKKGDYKNAYKYSLKTMQYKDSISGIKVKNKINEIRIKYETDKKERENSFLKKNSTIKDEIIALQITKSKNQFVIILFISFFVAILFFISIFIYRLFKNKKKLSQNLKETNIELKLANENVFHGINYAQKIQVAILASSEYVKEYFSDFFILNKPQRIVSGDFYWARKINDTVFFAVGDCTGHGIPGAFLTVLGTSLLNEIVDGENMQTDEILNILRDKVKKSLNQKGGMSRHSDGMDISFCSFNIITKELQFSGAYNSLYIKRANSKKTEPFQILKADRQPLGIFINEKPFSKQNITLFKSDIIYLFSDGYADQLKHDGTKKYGLKSFKNMLLSVSNKPMEEQQILLENEFQTWKGDFGQVDDVLVMGIKI